MDKFKKFLSFFGFCLLVGAVFNFFDHGSIFPSKPSTNINHKNCESELRQAFIKKAAENKQQFDVPALENYVRNVCNCARAEPKLGLSEAVSYCINKRKANEVSPISQAGQIQPPPRREEKNDLIKLGEFTGQYGKFATYLDMSLILKANQTYTSALIADSYNECLGNMPYCQKFRVVLFDCAGEKFFVGRQMTSKNGKTIQDVTFKENEVKIKRISTGSIESKVAGIICK